MPNKPKFAVGEIVTKKFSESLFCRITYRYKINGHWKYNIEIRQPIKAIKEEDLKHASWAEI